MENLCRQTLLSQIAGCESLHEIEQQRVALLGRQSAIQQALKTLGQTKDIAERKEKGASLNRLKHELEVAIQEKKSALALQERQQKLAQNRPDLTLPVRTRTSGKIHPIRRTMEEILTIFTHMGFQLKDGPDIEEDFYNFLALNFAENHPARQMQDTFFLQAKDEKHQYKLLRTHTSPVQIRSMLDNPPPIRIVAAGRTFRCDSDQTHAPMFHQVEGLWIDTHTHIGHLRGCLEHFCHSIFGVERKSLRFRPSYFPFTEPSMEVDIRCEHLADKITIGKGNDWMEILGCGMVHPHVLQHCGYDPNQVQGFAFGIGVERIAMLKYGISDLRNFTQGQIDWLQHYGFDAQDRPSAVFGLDPLHT